MLSRPIGRYPQQFLAEAMPGILFLPGHNRDGTRQPVGIPLCHAGRGQRQQPGIGLPFAYFRQSIQEFA